MGLILICKHKWSPWYQGVEEWMDNAYNVPNFCHRQRYQRRCQCCNNVQYSYLKP
ncbi:hypothetical protein [Spirosoma sp. KNUC1025]|uniref:hypothetical protein n=1 Tax=Spirosoma sp. KNUC1025 TaxID=2894082 RepID=UPI0038643990|nr:hypothetical protein LN737_19335 [Spirosoma sp. KNUC1025]